MEDLHAKWNHRWISPKAKSNNSTYHGFGVFAQEDISKGETVAILGGVVVPRQEIKEYWSKMGHVGIQIADDFFIVPTTRKEIEVDTGVFNHSCDANLGFADSIQLVAMKDIKAGEELAFDYAFNESYMEEFTCNCGDSNCRKTITKDDWKIPEIRQKYSEFFSPYLKSRVQK